MSKAQSIIFDLEDSVPKEEKNISRKGLSEFLIERVKGKEAVIRINSLDILGLLEKDLRQGSFLSPEKKYFLGEKYQKINC